jgi:GNAT superfamily N-acetyltransferase
MNIRFARVADAAAIAAVHARCWQVAYEHIFGADRLASMDSAERIARWRSRVQEPAQTSFVAEDDNYVVGFASSARIAREAATRSSGGLYVLPAAWGSGIARSLMFAGLANLRSAGYTQVVLWVLEDNPRGRRFYEREGWTKDGGERVGRHLEVETRELRYRRTLNEL